MTELDHAESTVKLYLSCINDVAKAMATAGNAACDLDEKRALELVAAMGWIKSRETYARFMMKRFVGCVWTPPSHDKATYERNRIRRREVDSSTQKRLPPGRYLFSSHNRLMDQ
jgi:hypothetical protein